MRFEKYTIDMPAGVAAGNGQPCHNLTDKWIHFNGIAGGCSFDVQGTIDEVTGHWVTLVTVTVDSIVRIDEGVAQIRLNRTVAGTTSPQPTAVLGGRNAHTGA